MVVVAVAMIFVGAVATVVERCMFSDLIQFDWW